MHRSSLKNATLMKESGLCEHKNYNISHMYHDVRLFGAALSRPRLDVTRRANPKAFSHLSVSEGYHERIAFYANAVVLYFIHPCALLVAKGLQMP